MSLESFVNPIINAASPVVSSVAQAGASFWQNSACSYSYIQDYIGWCPTYCERYAPQALIGVCNTVSDLASPVVDTLGWSGLVYGGILSVGAYAAYKGHQANNKELRAIKDKQSHLADDFEGKLAKLQDELQFQQMANQTQLLAQINKGFESLSQKMEDNKEKVKAEVLQNIGKQFAFIQFALLALVYKMDSLSPKQIDEEVDLIKRARKQLAAYMKQAGVSDIFYGDKIREMGQEILVKIQKNEPLFKNMQKIDGQMEQARLDRIIAAKLAESERTSKAKSPAYALHAERQVAPPVKKDEDAHASLMIDIRKAGGKSVKK